ncbi:MAG TPA: beta-galactosidase, partial [Candidatus Merdenecus merdavium]|nr:beta-galactosidase [Candidatus Merdenecus merdavium]
MKELHTDKLLYGGDYNPEQWLDHPEILKQDIEYFKKAGIQTITLGMFSWASLEPQEGVFRFEWMKEIVDRLSDAGMKVILGTPSGARPKWLAEKYEEVLRVDENRQRNLFGGRHNHCYTSPLYRKKVKMINQKLVTTFKDHQGVILWHISNEYGGECHCPLCQNAFREWLKNKYQSIDQLNKKWYTTFWSHTYEDFDQIESPSPRGENSLHALTLDWKRFVTDQTISFMEDEIAAIRTVDQTLPTTTNLMYYYKGLNPYKFSRAIDVASWDSYPTWHKDKESVTALDTGMMHDIIRSIKKKPFLLMESCPTATSWQPVSKLKKPGMNHLSSLQAIAHGSDSVLYFQLRQSRGSTEKFHGAVIDHNGGDDTRAFQEIIRIGDTLESIKELAGSKVRSDVGIIFDWENMWAMEDSDGPRNAGMYYKESVLKSYTAFRKLGLNVDVIDMEQEFSDYTIMVLPMLYMFRAGVEDKIRTFVEQGGTLIMTYWSGVVDENDLCFLNGTPHGVMDVMGVRRLEIDGLYDHEYNTASPTENNMLSLQKTYTCQHLCEIIEAKTAVPLMVYGKDFYKDTPVVTHNSYGEGEAYYIASDMEQDFYTDFYKEIMERSG